MVEDNKEVAKQALLACYWDLLISSDIQSSSSRSSGIPQGMGQPQPHQQLHIQTSQHILNKSLCRQSWQSLFSVFDLSSACVCVSQFVTFRLSFLNKPIMDRFQTLWCLPEHLCPHFCPLIHPTKPNSHPSIVTKPWLTLTLHQSLNKLSSPLSPIIIHTSLSSISSYSTTPHS